jgi:hypothetical protein
MFNNITGRINKNMNSSSAFKSIVALSTSYLGTKIFTVYKQEETKLKIEELKKDIAFKKLDIKKEIAFKELETKK